MEKVLARRKIFSGRVLELEVLEVETAAGVRTTREVVRHGGAVAVLAITAGGNIMLVRQYRVAVGRSMMEIVAGILDREEEDPADCARRELREETGFQAAELVRLGEIHPSPGYITERIHLFAARLEGRPGPAHLDHDEDLQTVELSPARFRRMVAAGEVQDGKTLAAWALFLERGLDRTMLSRTPAGKG
ncbi:MAG TPA: NUDIX hydrolase [Kiritimatiellae bacterium]|nr:NUDIX hydrolase [Kiritimatiellia bacterium]